ncbi:MAG: peptidase S51, partial [Blastocatellia bacterium]
MKPRHLVIAILILLATVAALAQKPANGPKKGALVIVGGGRVGPEIWDRFIQLAGGPGANFVYIPTASEDRTDGQ